MPAQMTLKLRLRPEAAQEAKAAVLEATQEVFSLDIKLKAMQDSPVTPEGLDYNREKHPNWPLIKVGGTGNNRRSIDVETEMTEIGPKSTLFTQSGYGGWLETGTSKMRAQPYLWPAFMAFKDKIITRAKELLR